MRVLAMCHAYPPHTGAGAETTLHDLLRAVADAGHTVDVLLSENRAPAAERVPYTVDGVTVWPYTDTGDPFRFIGTDRHPDVLVGQLQNTNRAAALARVHRIPMVHVVHNEQAQTRHLIRVGPADLVVYNTDWVRASITAWLDEFELTLPRREVVIHPPVRPEEYQVERPGDAVTVINLSPAKGAATFYELARRMPDRRFLGVVGFYGEQILMDLPNVDLIGPVPPREMTKRVYARTKVLLVPSSYETYGRVAIEACCAGIPVIASDTPGLAEALGPQGTCLPWDDVDAWAAALRKLTPRGWSAAAKRARAVAEGLTTTADLERFVKELEAVAKTPVGV